MDAQQVLIALANGKDVGGINAAIFSAQLRAAFAEGARAIGFARGVGSLLNSMNKGAGPIAPAELPEGATSTSPSAVVDAAVAETASPEAPAAPVAPEEKPATPAPAPAASANPAPSATGFQRGARWTPEEDALLVEAFHAKEPIGSIAERHHRTPVAIALRLHKPHGLLTEDQVNAVRTDFRQQTSGGAPAPTPAPVKAEQPEAPAIPPAVEAAEGKADDVPVLTDVVSTPPAAGIPELPELPPEPSIVDAEAGTPEQPETPAPTPAAPAAPAPEAPTQAGGMPQGLSDAERERVDGFLTKIKNRTPITMLRSYLGTEKGKQMFSAQSIAFLMEELNKAEAK